MAVLLDTDLIRALAAPLPDLSGLRDMPPRRPCLVAAWATGADGRLACRWNRETFPPD